MSGNRPRPASASLPTEPFLLSLCHAGRAQALLLVLCSLRLGGGNGSWAQACARLEAAQTPGLDAQGTCWIKTGAVSGAGSSVAMMSVVSWDQSCLFISFSHY